MNIRPLLFCSLMAILVTPCTVAAPPGKGGGPPPVVDLAYMNIPSSVWGEPNTAAVLGVSIGTDGAASGETSLWKGSSVYHASMSWDPGGNWVAWAQYVDKKGTRGIVAATPGSAPITVLRFPADGITRHPSGDNLAWGRGCDGRSVIVFLGDQGWSVLNALYVFDPFAATPRPRFLYQIRSGPEDSPSAGQSIAFSPQGRLLAFIEQDDEGRNLVVALPLTCVAGDPLPVAAGDTHVLFPVVSPDGIDGGRGATHSGIDWSPDGRRLAAAVAPLLVWDPGYRSWGAARIAVGELNYSYSASDDLEQVTPASSSLNPVANGPAGGGTDYSDTHPSWGPSGASSSCDRVAFNRSGTLMLMETPRDGFTQDDCTVAVPFAISGKFINGLDWK
jgi:hypothetical protein